MVLPANSSQKVNALACNTRRFGLILCFLLGLTLSNCGISIDVRFSY
jgi:hypothetical protein